MTDLNLIDELRIDALDDEALESIAGGKKNDSSGLDCCSAAVCSHAPETDTEIGA